MVKATELDSQRHGNIEITEVLPTIDPDTEQAEPCLLYTSTDPLIILDGVQVSSSDLNNLDPEIIDSFSILKDATATAMYGTRGANGVMIVTTKSGMNLDKPIINFRMEAQMSQPTSTPKFVDLSLIHIFKCSWQKINRYNTSLSRLQRYPTESAQTLYRPFRIIYFADIHLNNFSSIILPCILHIDFKIQILSGRYSFLIQTSFGNIESSITQSVSKRKQRNFRHISIGTVLHTVIFKIRQLVRILIKSNGSVSYTHLESLGDLKKANITVRNFPATVAELRKRIKLSEGGDTYLFASTLNNGQKVLIRCEKA